MAHRVEVKFDCVPRPIILTIPITIAIDMSKIAISRRRFHRRLLAGAGAATLWGALLPKHLGAEDAVPAMDEAMSSFMGERKIPGGALFVLQNGRLVYRRGYGWANRDQRVPVQPESLFRIASLSKPITALAVLKLVESNRLDLEARPWELLELEGRLPPGKSPDHRWSQVRVRHLLHHTAGWDPETSFDPMFRTREIAAEFGMDRPASPWDVIRSMLARPLDFDPGERYAYSNFGYCLLGRVIEKVSGQDYADYVRANILTPLGIEGMRLGKTQPALEETGEVQYYMPNDQRTRSVIPAVTDRVPWPYGGFWLESMDAHGGWVASVEHLARLDSAMGGLGPSSFPRPSTLRLLADPPQPPVSRKTNGLLEDTYYGVGWMVRPLGAARQPNFWHTGSLPGTYALWVRRGDGISYAALFNQRSNAWKEQDAPLDPLLARAAKSVPSWPRGITFW